MNMTQHSHFKAMCALAVSGQLSGSELHELTRHLQQCGDCRILVTEFEQISVGMFSSKEPRHRNCAVPDGMTERFVARAFSAGVPLHVAGKLPAGRKSLRLLHCAGALITGVLAVVLSLQIGAPSSGNSNTPEVSSSISKVGLPMKTVQAGPSSKERKQEKRISQRYLPRSASSRVGFLPKSSVQAASAIEAMQLTAGPYSPNRVPSISLVQKVSFLDFSLQPSIEETVSGKDAVSAKVASMHWKIPWNDEEASRKAANPLLLSRMQQSGALREDFFPVFRLNALRPNFSR